MAEVTIELRPRRDGGPLVVVRLARDEDWLPHEHEREHRRIVQTLLGAGIIDGPDDRIIVERERPAREPVLG